MIVYDSMRQSEIECLDSMCMYDKVSVTSGQVCVPAPFSVQRQ